MNKWIAEFDLKDGDTMPEHMDLEYKGVQLDFHCKPLEQESCEDAISRQAVLEGKVIHQSCDGIEIINSYAVPVEYIEQLPPVTPQPKMGHWITLKDEWGDINEAVCSCCDANGNHKWHYCPNCGCRMV